MTSGQRALWVKCLRTKNVCTQGGVGGGGLGGGGGGESETLFWCLSKKEIQLNFYTGNLPVWQGFSDSKAMLHLRIYM